MFDKINGPTNQYEGPATGLTTEKGDSWHTAVKKINDGFERFERFIEGGFSGTDTDANDDLRETVTALQIKVDALEAKVKAMGTAATPPAHGVVDEGGKIDPEAKATASFGTAGTLGAALTGGDTLKVDPPEPEVGKVTTTGPVDATSNG